MLSRLTVNGCQLRSRIVLNVSNTLLKSSVTTTTTTADRFHQPQIINTIRYFKTSSGENDISPLKPGSLAFAECETEAISDLFNHFANIDGGEDEEGLFLCVRGVRELLASIGERPDEITLRRIFKEADLNNDGKLHLHVSLYSSSLFPFTFNTICHNSINIITCPNLLTMIHLSQKYLIERIFIFIFIFI